MGADGEREAHPFDEGGGVGEGRSGRVAAFHP